jgi:hypothetical protein
LRQKKHPSIGLYCSHYTFPPTNTSTVARSSRFQVASPSHALPSPQVECSLRKLVAREDDQIEGLLPTVGALLGPVLDLHQGTRQLVGADHLRGYHLRKVGDRASGIVRQFRADDHGGILLLFGQEDADTASPSSRGWMDVVAGQMHRGIAPAEGYTESDDRPSVKLQEYRPHRPR